VERRPHPTHDDVTRRRVLAGVATAWFSVLGCWAAHEAGAGEWVVWPGPAGFLAGVAVITSTPVNCSPCPTCGARLARVPDATEFPCQACGVVWVTRSFGRGIRN
jgi:predicted RNA-binding Zn-ribbon protein involved in translation (DUF1610 family)